MPWQQHVADIAGEVDPRTGIPVYRTIVIVVPRQSGKTTLLLAEMVYRAWGMYATFQRPQNTVYAAQTGDDAIVKFQEHVKTLQASPFASMFSLDSVNGRHAIQWANGSTHRPTATTTKSGHGKTLDQGVADEYFAQIDYRVDQAFRPAAITRRDAQIFYVSTAGDATSIPLNAKMEENRLRLEAEPLAPSRTAYFEWSADPSMDPGAVETWLSCMPALGRTVHIDDIRAEFDDMTERDFRRAYLNQTDFGGSADQAFDPEDWKATAVETYISGPRAFAIDIANDRSWASIAAAGKTPDGDSFAEVVQHERGTAWVIPYLVDKFDRHPKYDRRVYIAGGSQAALMQDDLEKAGIDVTILSRADYAAACAKYSDGIENRTIYHLPTGQIPLDIAQAGAAWTTGDVRVWNRSKSTTIISPLVACSVATWGFTLTEANQYDVLDSIA